MIENLDEIAKKYKVKHEAQVPTSLPLERWTRGENLGLAWLITVIKNGINPILNQYDYPELCVKIGMSIV